MNFLTFAQGKKTYAVVAIGIALGVWQGLYTQGVVHEPVPSWSVWVLGFLGLGAARSGIQTQADNTTQNVVALVRDVLGQIEVAQPQQITLSTGHVITVGKPSGALTPAEEVAETKALNKAQ